MGSGPMGRQLKGGSGDGKRRELEVARHLGELMREGGVFVNTMVEP